jgi:hypothetical protein
VVIQLNRAVDFRDKLLDSKYHFKSIPGGLRTNKHAIMAELGLMKPYMKTRLDEIRNMVEHRDEAAPVSVQTCRELSDFVWYYLRWTDSLACRCQTEIAFDKEGLWVDTGCFLECEFEFEPWQFTIRGTVPGTSVSDACRDNYLKVRGQRSILAKDVCRIDGILLPAPDEQFRLARLCLTTI